MDDADKSKGNKQKFTNQSRVDGASGDSFAMDLVWYVFCRQDGLAHFSG